MSKLPSLETQLRTVKRELKDEEAITDTQSIDLQKLRNTVQMQSDAIGNLHKEIEDWKRRFDALLERTPKQDNSPS